MPIAAQRFKFLDQETSLPLADFNKLTDNSVFNMPEVQTAIQSLPTVSNEVLSSLNSTLGELSNISPDSSAITDAVESAMDSLSNMDLPDIAKDALSYLKGLDTSALTGFVKDLAGIGKSVLCSNLDFLKLFLLGYSLNKNIMSGLLLALLLSWLDRICSSQLTPDARQNTSNRGLIDTLLPVNNNQYSSNPNQAFGSFKTYYSDYLKQSTPMQSYSAFDANTFVATNINLPSNQVRANTYNLANYELSTYDRNNLLNVINNTLPLYSPITPQYGNLLLMKGQVNSLPPVSPARTNNNLSYQYLNDKLGGLVKAMPSVDLKAINQFTMTDLDKSLFSKFSSFKTNASSATYLQCRPNDTGGFDTANFSGIMPTLSSEETVHLTETKFESDSYKWRGMSPTADVFLEET